MAGKQGRFLIGRENHVIIPTHSLDCDRKAQSGFDLRRIDIMENKVWNVGSRPIYAYVDEYKDSIKIHLRRFYRSKEGEWKPSLKGIALEPKEWQTFKTYIQKIDLELLRQLTVQVERRPTPPPKALVRPNQPPVAVNHVESRPSTLPTTSTHEIVCVTFKRKHLKEAIP